jgi:hypothetical protein
MPAKGTTKRANSSYKFDKSNVFTEDEFNILESFDDRTDKNEAFNSFINSRGLTAQKVVLNKFSVIFPNMSGCPRGGNMDMYDPVNKLRVEVKYLSKAFVYGTDLKFTLELDYNENDNLFILINMGDKNMPIYRRLFGNVCIINGYHLRWCDLYNIYHEIKTLQNNNMKNTVLLHNHFKFSKQKAIIEYEVNRRVEAEMETRIADRIALTDSLIEDVKELRQKNSELTTRADDYCAILMNVFDLLNDAQKHNLCSRGLDLSEFMDVAAFEERMSTISTTTAIIGGDTGEPDTSMVPEQRNTSIEDFINQQWVTDTLYHYGMPYTFFVSEYERYCQSHNRAIDTTIRKKNTLVTRFSEMLEQDNGARRLSANINGVLKPTNKRAIIFNNTYTDTIKDRVTDYHEMNNNPYLRSNDYRSLVDGIKSTNKSINDIDYTTIPDRSKFIRFIDVATGRSRIKDGCGETKKLNGNYYDIITFFKAYAALLETDTEDKRTRKNAFVEYKYKGETITINASRWIEMFVTKNPDLHAYVNEHCFNRLCYNRDLSDVNVLRQYIIEAIEDAVTNRINFEEYEIKLSKRAGSLKTVCYKLICNSGNEAHVEWVGLIKNNEDTMKAIRECLIKHFDTIRKHKLDIFKSGPRTTCSCISTLVTEMKNRARFKPADEEEEDDD